MHCFAFSGFRSPPTKPRTPRLVRLERFELPTTCLEGRCSIQLSYRRSSTCEIELLGCKLAIPGQNLHPNLLANSSLNFDPRQWSGQRDLNPRPPAPKAGALAKLRYAPFSDKDYSIGFLLYSQAYSYNFLNCILELFSIRTLNFLHSPFVGQFP